MNNQVYGVFARENDYYAQMELHKLFFDEKDAEVYAQVLREMKDEYAPDELMYPEVDVCELRVN